MIVIYSDRILIAAGYMGIMRSLSPVRQRIRPASSTTSDICRLISSVTRIPVVTELARDDRYDAIFVVMRYTQIDAILDILRANGTKNIVFVGNNVSARALAEVLPEKNVLFAFALSAGQ